MQNEPEEAATVCPPPRNPPARPSSPDILPLAPELQALLDQRGDDEEAGRLFAAGRCRRVDAFLRGLAVETLALRRTAS
jgi:hypothetical protein